MPCMDGREHQDAKINEIELRSGRKAGALLCRLMRDLEKRGQLPNDPDLLEWYIEHKFYDAAHGR